MRGSLRRRGATWTALWDGIDPATGKRRQRSKGGFRTRREAEHHLATVVTATAVGGYVEPSKTPFGHFLFNEWLDAVESTVRPTSYQAYSGIVRRYIAEHEIGAMPLRALSGAHLTAFYGDLERAGLSDATRRSVHAVISRSLNDAVRWGRLTRNPVHAAVAPPASHSRAQAWTGSELRRFLAQIADNRLAAMWRTMATTGMRKSEVLGLTWRCVDLDGHSLRVEQQILALRGGLRFGPPKTRRSERTIALDEGTVEALCEHRETQQLERAVAGPVYCDGDLVFCNEIGQPISPHLLTEWFKRHRDAAGIPTGTAHTLRHTMATTALTDGVPLRIVAARLGDDPRTTLGVYSHLLPSSDSAAAESLARILVDKPLTNRATGPFSQSDGAGATAGREG
jgi:integrase